MNPDEFFDRLDRIHNQQKGEFQKLLLDQCADIPKVGDRVVVACGLIGMGFPWVRKEAIVLEIGSASYKVGFMKRQRDGEVWIHPALITDVLPKERDSEKETQAKEARVGRSRG